MSVKLLIIDIDFRKGAALAINKFGLAGLIVWDERLGPWWSLTEVFCLREGGNIQY